MATKDPSAITSKWLSNISGATASITAGVNAVTTAPGQSAAKQKQRWLNRIMESADKWAANVSSVSLSQWQEAMINVGIPRIASGAQAKQGKYLAFINQFMPFLESGSAKISAMPKNTLQDSIAKAGAQITYNASFKYRKGA